MVIVFTSSAVDRGLVPRSSQTKDLVFNVASPQSMQHIGELAGWLGI